MVDGYYSAVRRELQALGFRYLANAKGSHEKWGKDGGLVLIIPRNLKSRHTANAILKQAGAVVRF